MQLRVGGSEDGRRRSRAAEFPNGNAEASRLVGKIVLDSSAREMHDADRHKFEHAVVALERRRLGVLGPVRLEGDLWNLPGDRPFGGDQFGTLWRAAMDQDHVRMLGVNLVETIPDQVVVVEVEAASECDLRPRGQHDLGLGTTLGGDKVSGVDHCCSERAMVDKRTRAGAPG